MNGVPAAAPSVASSAAPSAAATTAQAAQDFAPFYSELSTHLLSTWTTADLSDFQLHANFHDGSSSSYHIHSVIVSRSPVLKAMLHSAFGLQQRALLLPVSDPSITGTSLGLVLASLYSPSVLSHLSPQTAPQVLATASFLALDRLAALAYSHCEAAAREARTADDVAFWVAFVDRERGPSFPAAPSSAAAVGSPLPPGSPASATASGLNGPTPPASVNGSSSPAPAAPLAGPSSSSHAGGEYEHRLRAVLLDRLVALPAELGAFDPARAATRQPELIDTLKRLPFEVFKAVVEDPRFAAPSDMDRFNFAKKVIAARKQLFLSSLSSSSSSASSPSSLSGPPPDFEETVVLQFGQTGPGASPVNVLRKQRRPQLWKIGGH